MSLLVVSHHPQRTQSDCLPVCAQMVTDYLGLPLSYSHLVKRLGTRSFGTPFRNIKELEKDSFAVIIGHMNLAEIRRYLTAQLPVLAGVHTADLSYWSQAVDHMVVVIGVDDSFVYVNDPSLVAGRHPIPHVEFELAQLGFDQLCAVLHR
ncbi:MAG: C39 family peptidase [Ardenticatenaceae bacterium]|nr:C39 family peptidase [Ardenticatenaceae bacterium]